MKEQWEAKVIFRPDFLSNAVYVFRRVGYGAREYLRKNNRITTHGPGVATKDDPYLVVLDDEQLRALGIAINNSGYKAPDEHLIEGKLTATERHLEDMRNLVFKHAHEAGDGK